MSLGTAANYAQILSILPLFAAAAALYLHHKCADCWRMVLGNHGRIGEPRCHEHGHVVRIEDSPW